MGLDGWLSEMVMLRQESIHVDPFLFQFRMLLHLRIHIYNTMLVVMLLYIYILTIIYTMPYRVGRVQISKLPLSNSKRIWHDHSLWIHIPRR